MSEILTLATTLQLAHAVEGNLHDLFRSMMQLPGSEMVECGDVSYHLAFPTNPLFKSVWGTRLTTENADAVIDETLDWFRERNAPFAFWWVNTFTRPTDLAEHLRAHGLELYDEGNPGMGVELSRLNEDIRVPAGLKIIKVQTEQQVQEWGETFVAGFDVPPWAAQAWVDATLGLGVGNTPWTLYVGYLNDRPVATNMLYCGGGVASVYAVGTIPEARGQGIGAQVTLQPLLDARTQGYKYGVLFSTEMGHPVYERLGFRDVGMSMGRYLWRNS